MTEITEPSVPSDPSDTSVPSDPSNPADPSGPEAPTKRRRRPRANVVLVVLAVLIVLGGGAAFASGMHASSQASKARRENATFTSTRRQLKVRADHALTTWQSLMTAAGKVSPSLDALGQSLDDAATSQHHLVDVDNHGVDQYNAGNDGAAVATFSNDGAAALADLTQKMTAEHGALATAQQAVQALQEALSGIHR
jgi:uncharacterized protein HemX